MINSTNSYVGVSSAARLGANHGYLIQGDVACLNAELAIDRESSAAARNWALQLWACDAPYGGGALSGVKVAEAAVELHGSEPAQPQRLYTETYAGLPGGDRDYSMVLVLASGAAGAFDRVHDFANYPARERFVAPHFEGSVACVRDAGQIAVTVEKLSNPRSADNLSGSLALEVWALEEPYVGGPFAGETLCGVELGVVHGQASVEPVHQRLTFPVGKLSKHDHVVLMLREWTGNGYVTRDFRTLDVADEVRVAEPPPKPVASVAAVAPVAVAPVAVAPVAVAPVAVAPVASVAEADTQPCALVSIQHASLEELAAVKGLNRKLAVEIIKARPFRSFDQLVRVRGIGEKTIGKLRLELKL